MNCADLKELLAFYVDGKVEGDSLLAIERHLSGCSDCREEVRIMREAKEILAQTAGPVIPEGLDNEFLAKFRPLKTAPKPIVLPIPVFRNAWAPASVAATMLIIAVYFYIASPSAMLSDAKGMVKICRAGRNEWSVVEAGTVRVGKNDIIKTFQNSQVDISMNGISSIRLKSNTELKLASLGTRFIGSDIKYFVNKGKILVNHTSRKASGRFNIDTPESINTALGTNFMVSVLPEANKSWTGVLDGKVLVRSASLPSKSVLVGAGQKTEIYMNKAPSQPTALADEEWGEIQELYQIGMDAQVSLLISSGEGRVRELLKPCGLYISDKSHSLGLIKARETVEIFNKAIKEHSKEKHMEAIAKLEDIVSDMTDSRNKVQLLLYIGAYYSYIGEYEEAIDVFEKVVKAYPDSRLAPLAECAIAVIYGEKIQDFAKSQDAYNKILTDYPQSPEAVLAKQALQK